VKIAAYDLYSGPFLFNLAVFEVIHLKFSKFARNIRCSICTVEFGYYVTKGIVCVVINVVITEQYNVTVNIEILTGKAKAKGKSVPLQTWTGPEVSRKLRFPDFMTTAQDGGKVISLTHRPPLPPGDTPGTHFC